MVAALLHDDDVHTRGSGAHHDDIAGQTKVGVNRVARGDPEGNGEVVGAGHGLACSALRISGPYRSRRRAATTAT
jgi:hypothetical protein